MGSIGKIISTKIQDFVIATIESRLGFKIEAPIYSASGDDSPPLTKDKIFKSPKDGTGNYVILGNLMISQGAKAGEKILYSRDSNGAVKSKLYLNANGEFIFNDGSDNAVRFSKLEEQISILNNKYDAHTHPDPVSGSTGVPTVPLGLDISSSKVEEIKIP